ncbi:MAG: hypothetical protein AAFN66_05370 [Pseudomonadota bacterium]
MRQLKKPKNKRKIEPKCCMTCKHCITDNDGDLVCERDSEYLGGHQAFYTICDYYTKS